MEQVKSKLSFSNPLILGRPLLHPDKSILFYLKQEKNNLSKTYYRNLKP